MWTTQIYALTVACSWLMAALALRHPRWASGAFAHAAYRRSAVSYCIWSTLLLPPVYLALDRAVATPNGTRLVLAATAILGAYATLPWLRWFVPPTADGDSDGRETPPIARGPLDSPAPMLVALVGSGVAFLLARRAGGVGSEPRNGAFLVAYGRDPWLLLFLLLSHGYVAAAYLRIVVAYLPVVRTSLHRFPDPIARCRFQCAVYTACLGLGYNLHELARASLYYAGFPAHPASHGAIASLLLAAYNVALLVCHYGSFRWPAHYLAYRQLAPLWWALHRAIPTLAQRPPWSRATDGIWLGPAAAGDRLRARIYEIWDGISTLYPYRSAALAERARADCVTAAIPTYEIVPIVEAALLRASIAARERHVPPATRRSPLPGLPQGSLGEQIAFLQRVAWAWQRSPIVASLSAEGATVEADGARGAAASAGRPPAHQE